ncbi:MAG: hypothetical protein HOJ31_10150 [Anaerolineae bacterium]|jgi:hypothetical protein|nr:hypothetical protein [Anaerolineae bacterium]
MTQSNQRWKKRVEKSFDSVFSDFNIREFLSSKRISDEFMHSLILALEPEFAKPKRVGDDTLDLLGYNNPELNAKLKAESDMCERVEAALKIAPAWDSKKDPWGGYHIKLVAKEKETGFTIEQFVKWWNSDDFRKKQGIWLNPEKIDRFWPTAMSETDTLGSVEKQEPTEFQKVKDWTPAPKRK